jgi:hypothetical protein
MTNNLRRRLDKYMAESHKHIPKEKRDHIIDGTCRITAACQKTYRIDIIKHSFEKTGQYNSTIGFDFDVKMGCCTTPIPQQNLKTMRDRFKELTTIFRKQGYITEEQLDDANIMSIDDGRSKPKDERVPHQQRAMILNTKENITRLAQYQVPEAILPVNRRIYEENAKQRKKREAKELTESIKKAKQETKDKQAEERKQTMINKKALKQASVVRRKG